MSNAGFLWRMVLVLWAGLALGFLFGDWSREHHERTKAIEAGVGCWECDPRTGVSEFVYKPQRVTP